MAKESIYDTTRRDDPAYWAAALVSALENRNSQNAETARLNLQRLGYDLRIACDMPSARTMPEDKPDA